MCEIKNVKYYQELTYEALSKSIESEARKGCSKWYLPNGMYMGEKMIQYLKDKGFNVLVGSNFSYISW